MQWATIDPGLAGTGYAVWSEAGKLLDHGVITVRSLAITNKKAALAFLLSKKLDSAKVARIYIEYPRKFQGVKGDMVANRGDLVKLAELVGYLTAFFEAKSISVDMVPVNTWKGQMTKLAVIHRIKRLLPLASATSHDWDAIGIGLHIQGKF